jgi:hypothetical protein
MSEPDPKPPRPHRPRHGASPLDAILVLGTLGVIGGVLLGLFVLTVPQANLPIISGLAGAMVSAVISGYAGYRWGASEAQKQAGEP